MTYAKTALLIASTIASLAACSDDDPIPIEEIPDEAKLIELSAAEFEGVCAWASGIVTERLPQGTNCNGIPITLQGCRRPPPECLGTVGQWKVCMPAFIERIAQDPCAILDAAFSAEAAMDFVEETPGCATLGPGATAM